MGERVFQIEGRKYEIKEGRELLEVVSESQYLERINQLSSSISRRYADQTLYVIPILMGGIVFGTDLSVALTQRGVNVRADVMQISSYGEGQTSGEPEVLITPQKDLRGQNVLIVDDVGDTRKTLGVARRIVKERGATTIETAVAVDKYENRTNDIELDYVGFEFPNNPWLVGCGMGDGDDLRFSRSINIKLDSGKIEELMNSHSK